MKTIANKIYRPTNKPTLAKYKHLLLSGLLLAMLVATGLPGLSRAADVAASPNKAAAQVPGILYGWGSGWLGNGSESTAVNPVAVNLPPGVTGFTAVASGEQHTVAIGNDGKLYAWGGNAYGQLGNGTEITSSVPVAVNMPAGVSSFTRISVGYMHSLALADNGKLYAWGLNVAGVLGIGNFGITNQPSPVVMPSGVNRFTDFVAVAEHSLALGDNGRAYAWGNCNWGQLGDGINEDSFTPRIIPLPEGVTSFTAIAAGGHHNLAIGNNGKTYVWGTGFFVNGSNEQVTIPTPTERKMPTNLAGVSFKEIYAGWQHDLALGNDGKYYVWGANFAGQLGNGATANDGTVIPLSLPAGVTRFTQVSSGMMHMLGLGDDGNLYGWGFNGYGQLGDGTTNSSTRAVLIGKGFTQIGLGSNNVKNSYAFVQPVTAAPTYRFYRLSNGTHFYTMDEKEKATLINQYANEMKYEGVAYQSYGWVGANLSPVYRFFNTQTKAHFYTANEWEKANLIAHYSQLYTYEGHAFYAQLTASEGTKPIHRFYNYQTHAHFYTANEAEKDALIDNWPQLYNYEGIAFYGR